MIYDCFIVSDELDLLELRLRLLDGVVDRFIACEAPFTFRGQPKALHVREHLERFAAWRDRLVVLAYPGPPQENPWHNEWGQRDYLAHGLAGCDEDDLILLSDCDEIPDPANVARYPPAGQILAHDHTMFVGYLNRQTSATWIGTRSLAAADLAAFGTLSNVRKQHATEAARVVGGWHLSSLGGADVFRRKMRENSHTEQDTPYETDPHALRIAFGSAGHGRWVEPDPRLRQLIPARRWDHWTWDGPTIRDAKLAARLAHVHGCCAYVPEDAATVAAITDDRDAWEQAGIERFGTRFRGAGGLADLALDDVSWIVVDRLERHDASLLQTLAGHRASVVVFAANARSHRTVDAVLHGAPFPPGRALHRGVVETSIASAGYRIEQFERLHSGEFFVPWNDLPEHLGLDVGLVRFPATTRDEMRTYLSHAHLWVLSRR